MEKPRHLFKIELAEEKRKNENTPKECNAFDGSLRGAF